MSQQKPDQPPTSTSTTIHRAPRPLPVPSATTPAPAAASPHQPRARGSSGPQLPPMGIASSQSRSHQVGYPHAGRGGGTSRRPRQPAPVAPVSFAAFTGQSTETQEGMGGIGVDEGLGGGPQSGPAGSMARGLAGTSTVGMGSMGGMGGTERLQQKRYAEDELSPARKRNDPAFSAVKVDPVAGTMTSAPIPSPILPHDALAPASSSRFAVAAQGNQADQAEEKLNKAQTEPGEKYRKLGKDLIGGNDRPLPPPSTSALLAASTTTPTSASALPLYALDVVAADPRKQPTHIAQLQPSVVLAAPPQLGVSAALPSARETKPQTTRTRALVRAKEQSGWTPAAPMQEWQSTASMFGEEQQAVFSAFKGLIDTSAATHNELLSPLGIHLNRVDKAVKSSAGAKEDLIRWGSLLFEPGPDPDADDDRRSSGESGGGGA